jgi:hypothetical protein
MRTHYLLSVIVMAAPLSAAVADVTIQERTQLNVDIVKMQGTNTTRISGDRERVETDMRCDGTMSMLCRKIKALEVVRLDRDLSWSAEPNRKRYTELVFPSPEQRMELGERMHEIASRQASCPVQQAPTIGPDTSKCKMSEPRLTVEKSNEFATIAGHQARRTTVLMTQSCTIHETADLCEMAYSFDSWMSQEKMPELAQRQDFERRLAQRMGVDAFADGRIPEHTAQFISPYAGVLKQLAVKSGELKGYPLKTTFKFAMGGPRCGSVPAAGRGGESSGSVLGDASSAAAQVAADSTESAVAIETRDAVSQAAGNGVTSTVAGSAAGAFAGKLVGGILDRSRKKPRDADAPAPAAPPGHPAVTDGLSTLAELTIEIIAINTEPIPDDQFEMPTAWKKSAVSQNELPAVPECPIKAH